MLQPFTAQYLWFFTALYAQCCGNLTTQYYSAFHTEAGVCVCMRQWTYIVMSVKISVTNLFESGFCLQSHCHPFDWYCLQYWFAVLWTWNWVSYSCFQYMWNSHRFLLQFVWFFLLNYCSYCSAYTGGLLTLQQNSQQDSLQVVAQTLQLGWNYMN